MNLTTPAITPLCWRSVWLHGWSTPMLASFCKYSLLALTLLFYAAITGLLAGLLV
jgi:hypothetical protein